MLRVQELSEFNELYIQYDGLTNNHLRIIQEGLIYDLFPINSLSKHKRAMRRAIRKPRSMTFKRFFGKVDVNEQLPSAITSIGRLQENYTGRSQLDSPACSSKYMGETILPTRMVFRAENLQVNLCYVRVNGSF